MYVEKIPWEVNYDASEMPPYTLPELLRCQDGTVVKNSEEWMTKRRPELLQMFKDYMYGEFAPLPDRVRYELLSEKKDAREGRALRREVRIHLEMDNGKSHHFDVLYYIPANAEKKVPVFVGLTFGGNHVVSTEEDIGKTALQWDSKVSRVLPDRGIQSQRFPLDDILGRGYAVAVASYHEIFPDCGKDFWKDSIYKLFFSGDELKRPHGYSSIGAWAWGVSRIMDYLETVPEIDADKACVFGHSRLGKTSLWAGVNDERFKVICVNDSGCGGAALSRRLYGETLYSMMYYYCIGVYWFSDVLESYSKTPEKLPFDQHELLALAAPRAIAVHSATEDQWADPVGEYLSTYHASKVYPLFGMQELESETPPEPEQAVGTDISYYCRIGKHEMLLSDWEHYMSVADRVFGK